MSTFQNAVAFMINLGVYDVVLPFLLVFTLVFALLEKTKVLGVEKHGSETYTKKNLNAMIAFVTGFLIIASTELVRVINTVLATSVLLVLLAVLFLMLVGVFSKDQEFALTGGWLKFFTGLMFAGIVLIFLHALGWLYLVWDYLVYELDGPVVGSFLLLIVVVGGMYFIAQPSGPSHDKKGDK